MCGRAFLFFPHKEERGGRSCRGRMRQADFKLGKEAMTFTVTYREKSGSKAETEIESASRAACLAECRARGIVPIGIREGRSSSRCAAANTGSHRLLLAGAFLVIAVIGVAWWFWSRSGTQSVPPSKPPVEKRTKALAPKREPHIHERPTATQQVAAVPPVAIVPQTNAVVVPPKRTTNRDPSNTNVVERIPGRGIIHHIKPRTKPLPLKYSSERDIARLVLFKPGQLYLPVRLGKRFEDDFKASLNDKIEILPTDTEDEVEIKKAVIEGKRVLKEAMDRGEDVVKIMEESQKELENLATYRNQLERDLRQIQQTGTPEEVEDFVNAANKLMKQYGIDHPLRMPLKEKMFLRRERRAAASNTESQVEGEQVP